MLYTYPHKEPFSPVYKNGDIIPVNHICSSHADTVERYVTYEENDGDPGIRVDEYWFSWNHFFEVNFIVKPK